MTSEEIKIENFVKTHPDANFIGYIKVGNRGVPEFYVNKSEYDARRDKVWDSGHDFTSHIVKDIKTDNNQKGNENR